MMASRFSAYQANFSFNPSVVQNIINNLSKNKCEEIKLYENIAGYLSDNVLIATASSERHCVAAVNELILHLKKSNIQYSSSITTGSKVTQSKDWIVVDCGSIIIHVMSLAKRSYYNIDSLMSMMQSKTNPQTKNSSVQSNSKGSKSTLSPKNKVSESKSPIKAKSGMSKNAKISNAKSTIKSSNLEQKSSPATKLTGSKTSAKKSTTHENTLAKKTNVLTKKSNIKSKILSPRLNSSSKKDAAETLKKVSSSKTSKLSPKSKMAAPLKKAISKGSPAKENATPNRSRSALKASAVKKVAVKVKSKTGVAKKVAPKKPLSTNKKR